MNQCRVTLMPQVSPVNIFARLSVVIGAANVVRDDQPMDFDREVRPILVQHCFKCHDADSAKGGLRLDFKPAMLKGGDSGEATVVPGSSHKSHLIAVVTSTDPDSRMPPKGDRLTPAQVDLFRKWIDGGAHWASAAATQPATVEIVEGGMRVTDADRAFWSFVPPKKTEPTVTRPGGTAPGVPDKDEWSRTSVDRFILAAQRTAKLSPSTKAPRDVLVRRLAYDLTGLPPTPDVVAAFVNDDSPDAYDRLVERFLTSPAFGERMASLWLPLARYAEDQAHQVGNDTKAFYPHAWKYRQWVVDAFNRDLPYDRFLRLQIAGDRVKDVSPADLAALGFLGLGPKYYNRGRIEVMADEWEDRVDTVTRTTLGLTVACARCHDHKFDPIPAMDYYALAGVFASTEMVNRTAAGEVQKNSLSAEQMNPATLHVVADAAAPKDLNLFIRGNPDRKGPVVPRRFLTVLSAGDPKSFTDGSGRLELADAIVSKQNPLTARVMVNRVWGMLFGSPLVATPSNFGRTGQLPTHPELLDDLSVRFMENGWSMKWLIRELVTSAAYRQSSDFDAGKAAIDPANEKLWRMNRRRLTVEQWRDSLLTVAGEMQSALQAPSLELDNPKHLSRTLYARISRLKLNDLLMQFDYPDANVHAEKRSVTSTPAQKLFVLNSPFVLARAKALANRLAADAASDDEGRIRRAYELLFARKPSPDELAVGLDYLHQPDDGGKQSHWERYAQILLASNEALYVD